MISLIINSSIVYPSSEDSFSPDESYPEYRFRTVSTHQNLIYKYVRDCFLQAKLDQEHIGSSKWNPLGGWIKPGMRVFVLCNFANERRENETLVDYQSRCTHGSVIRAVVDYILIAVGENGHVELGNAPTQFCHWDRVLADTGTDKIAQIYRENGLPVEVRRRREYYLSR